MPVLGHTVAAASSAVEPSAQSSALAPARPKPKTFAARYPPADPGRKAGWDNMVRVYDKQKEEDKKNGTTRRMTQGEWYTQHAVGYGLQIRKKQAAMKQPSAHPGGPSAGEDNGAGGEEVAHLASLRTVGTKWRKMLRRRRRKKRKRLMMTMGRMRWRRPLSECGHRAREAS